MTMRPALPSVTLDPVDPLIALARAGGIAPRRALLREGVTHRALSAALAKGSIIRIRQGWYGVPGHDGVATTRLRGTAACITAARHWGLWVQDDFRIHVRTSEHHSRLPEDPAHVRRHIGVPKWPAQLQWRDSVMDTIFEIARCQPLEHAVAVTDSALNKGILSSAQLYTIIAALPTPAAAKLSRTDGRAESGLESIVRIRLQDLGYRPQPQVRLPGIGRVDLLLSNVVIELDGREFHESTFDHDRRRDARATAAGLHALRFGFGHIMNEWPLVVEAIERAYSDQ